MIKFKIIIFLITCVTLIGGFNLNHDNLHPLAEEILKLDPETLRMIDIENQRYRLNSENNDPVPVSLLSPKPIDARVSWFSESNMVKTNEQTNNYQPKSIGNNPTLEVAFIVSDPGNWLFANAEYLRVTTFALDAAQALSAYGMYAWYKSVNDLGGIDLGTTGNVKAKINITCINVGKNSTTIMANTINVANNLANGVYGNFSFVVRNYQTGGTPVSLACQKTLRCITFDGLLSALSGYSCTSPLPSDCIANNLGIGQPRFTNTISTLQDPSIIFTDFAAWLFLQGVTSMSIYGSAIQYNALSTNVRNQGSAYGINTIDSFPWSTVNSGPTHDSILAEMITIHASNPDVFVITAAGIDAANVLIIRNIMDEIEFSPKVVVVLGGALAVYVSDPRFANWYASVPWDQSFKGSIYESTSAPGHLIPFSNPSAYGLYMNTLFPGVPNTFLALCVLNTLMGLIMQRMYEYSYLVTGNLYPTAADLIKTKYQLAGPGPTGLMNLDQFNRITPAPRGNYQQQLNQLTGVMKNVFVTPLTVAQQANFPMPTPDQIKSNIEYSYDPVNIVVAVLFDLVGSLIFLIVLEQSINPKKVNNRDLIQWLIASSLILFTTLYTSCNFLILGLRPLNLYGNFTEISYNASYILGVNLIYCLPIILSCYYYWTQIGRVRRYNANGSQTSSGSAKNMSLNQDRASNIQKFNTLQENPQKYAVEINTEQRKELFVQIGKIFLMFGSSMLIYLAMISILLTSFYKGLIISANQNVNINILVSVGLVGSFFMTILLHFYFNHIGSFRKWLSLAMTAIIVGSEIGIIYSFQLTRNYNSITVKDSTLLISAMSIGITIIYWIAVFMKNLDSLEISKNGLNETLKKKNKLNKRLGETISLGDLIISKMNAQLGIISGIHISIPDFVHPSLENQLNSLKKLVNKKIKETPEMELVADFKNTDVEPVGNDIPGINSDDKKHAGHKTTNSLFRASVLTDKSSSAGIIKKNSITNLQHFEKLISQPYFIKFLSSTSFFRKTPENIQIIVDILVFKKETDLTKKRTISDYIFKTYIRENAEFKFNGSNELMFETSQTYLNNPIKNDLYDGIYSECQKIIIQNDIPILLQEGEEGSRQKGHYEYLLGQKDLLSFDEDLKKFKTDIIETQSEISHNAISGVHTIDL